MQNPISKMRSSILPVRYMGHLGLGDTPPPPARKMIGAAPGLQTRSWTKKTQGSPIEIFKSRRVGLGAEFENKLLNSFDVLPHVANNQLNLTKY